MPTKTVTKKKIVVKRGVKKIVSRKRVQKATVCACAQACQPEHSFWVNNGPVVCSVCELRDALATMSDDQYQHHTLRSGNDFASWIRDCFGDEVLANKVAGAKNKKEAVRALSTCCK